MNVIVGVIVDSVNTSRKEIEDEDRNSSAKENVTLESLSVQIADLQKTIHELKQEKLKNQINSNSYITSNFKNPIPLSEKP